MRVRRSSTLLALPLLLLVWISSTFLVVPPWAGVPTNTFIPFANFKSLPAYLASIYVNPTALPLWYFSLWLHPLPQGTKQDFLYISYIKVETCKGYSIVILKKGSCLWCNHNQQYSLGTTVRVTIYNNAITVHKNFTSPPAVPGRSNGVP